MPPKYVKKTSEDAAEVDVEIVETLSPFYFLSILDTRIVDYFV